MNNHESAECEAIGITLIENEKQVSIDTMLEKKPGIYGLQNKLKPDKWNIGQTTRKIEDRWNDYKKLNIKKQPKIYNALKKYGWDGFNKIVIETLPDNITEKKCIISWLNEREIYWIRFYKSVEIGYNTDRGGSFCFGRVVSDETKRKMSDSHKGKPGPNKGKKMSSKSKEKMIKSLTGKVYGKRSQQTVNRLKEAWVRRKERGWKHSEESKKKMSDSRIGYKPTENHKKKIGLASLAMWKKRKNQAV